MMLRRHREPVQRAIPMPPDPLRHVVHLDRGTLDCLKRHAKALKRSPDRLLNDLVRKLLEDDLVLAVLDE